MMYVTVFSTAHTQRQNLPSMAPMLLVHRILEQEFSASSRQQGYLRKLIKSVSVAQNLNTAIYFIAAKEHISE